MAGIGRVNLSRMMTTCVNEDSLTLLLPRKRLSGCACHSPLAHFYIHHSQSSIREIHPFTTITHLASKKPTLQGGELSISIQFLFRQSMPTVDSQSLTRATSKQSIQWTNKLASLVDEEKTGTHITNEDTSTRPNSIMTSTEFSESSVSKGIDTPLRLEGPYFTLANPESYRTVVCLVAGTGLSGAIAIAAAFKAHRSGLSSHLKAHTSVPDSAHSIAIESTQKWDRCVVIWSVREKDYVEMPFFHGKDVTSVFTPSTAKHIIELKTDGLEFRAHKTGGGRPRLNTGQALTEICGQGRDSWCYISGPNGFISAAERSCQKIKHLTWFAARWD